jgi:hypothetical protein
MATAAHTPYERVIAVFDWLRDLVAQTGFRGCGSINLDGSAASVS